MRPGSAQSRARSAHANDLPSERSVGTIEAGYGGLPAGVKFAAAEAWSTWSRGRLKLERRVPGSVGPCAAIKRARYEPPWPPSPPGGRPPGGVDECCDGAAGLGVLPAEGMLGRGAIVAGAAAGLST